MSAAGTALLAQESESSLSWAPRRERWWQRFTHRCASPECPHRGTLWPVWLRKARGVEFAGRWYCQVACLHASIAPRVHHLLATFRLEKPRAYRLPLGLLLVNRGALSYSQLRAALQAQRESRQGRLGDWVLQLGMINESQLLQALGQQWGCPVFPLEFQPARLAWSDLVPLPLLDSARAVPAYSSPDGRILHIAFADRVDHTLLYAVEQMLGCRTVACVSSAREITQFLEQLHRGASREEICFDTVRDPREITATICNYAEILQAGKVSIARAASHLWVRFHRGRSSRDLLFRVLPPVTSMGLERTSVAPKPFSISADEGKDGVSDAFETV